MPHSRYIIIFQSNLIEKDRRSLIKPTADWNKKATTRIEGRTRILSWDSYTMIYQSSSPTAECKKNTLMLLNILRKLNG
jgi:hypothetical protein